tara:strand:- start:99 stop:770 length:672 start_codon:yes stop_codon:yes gene_type:complete
VTYLDFSGVLSRTDLLIRGAELTIAISLTAMIFALVIGLCCASMLLSPLKPLRFIVLGYVEVIRNTPFIVQVFLVYFGLPSLGIRLTPLTAAILAMSIYGGAYTSEIIRSGIQSIAKGQIEAGRSLGMSPLQIFRYIVLKPAFSAIFPSLASQFVLLLLSSSVVSAISVPELTGVGNDIQGMTLRNMEIYLVIAVIYVGIVAVLKLGCLAFERIVFRFKYLGR